MAAATGIVLIAGTITFANEWYQTKQVNWKVPIATMLGAAVIDGLSHVNDKAAIGLSVMVLIAASITQFNGKSAVQSVAGIFTQQPGSKQQQYQRQRARAA